MFLSTTTNEKVPYLYIRRIQRLLGVFKLLVLTRPSPSISCGEAKHSPFPLSAGPISSVGIGSTRPPEGSTAVDPPPLKGQQALTLFGLLQKPKVYAEVLPLSDVNAKERLSRTPKGCLGPPQRGSR